jgi:hypothetical protein
MCHVIAFSPGGPRGSEAVPGDQLNRYENLILLCPTHHVEVDRAPADYTVDQLLERKRAHEARVTSRLNGKRFDSISELMNAVLGLLNENFVVWETLGPESIAARANPLTKAAEWWKVRKLATIIPNNAQIIAWFDTNRELLTPEQLRLFALFREHALALESSTFARMDMAAQPRFPQEFRQMIERLAMEPRPADREVNRGDA